MKEAEQMPNAIHDITFSDLIVAALTQYPDRDAFVMGDRRVTYAATADLVSQASQMLAARGVGHGSGVAAVSSNLPEAWIVQAATYLLGGHFTGLQPSSSAEDLADICDEAEIKVLVAHPDEAERAASVAERSGHLQHLLTFGRSDLAPDFTQECLRYSPAALRRGPAATEDLGWLQYTGGTTGRPKGVMVPHRAMVQQVQTALASPSLPMVPRYLATAPITHAAGLQILPSLLRGGTVVMDKGFDPDRFCHLIDAEQVNCTLAVPTMLYVLLDSGAADRHDLSSLETITYGASPMAAPKLAAALDRFGPVFAQGYGQTESCAIGTALLREEHDPGRRPELLTSSGRPVIGARVEILDEEGNVCDSDQVGEICIRSRGVMTGYWKNAELTAHALRGQWLHTGDMGRRDENGYFHVVDRKNDMVISGGFNVYPKEVEDALTAHPGISTAAVIGVPDDRWGEAVMAYVVTRPGVAVDLAELSAFVRDRKGPIRTPKTIHLVDALPTTATGKVNKRALRAEHWAGQSRKVN